MGLRSAVAVLAVGKIARSLARVKGLLTPHHLLGPQLLLQLESHRLATLVPLPRRRRRNLPNRSKARAKVTATRRSVVVVDVVVRGRAMAQFAILPRWMPRLLSAVKVVSAMVDQLVDTSCAFKYAMVSPKWQSWKAAA
jgi:hypothetical protein